MCTNNIKATFRIPFPYNKPDLNGVSYSKEAINKVISSVSDGGLPVTFYTADGASHILGVTERCTCNPVWDEPNSVVYIPVECTIYMGGTECLVLDSTGTLVEDLDLVGFGFSCGADNNWSEK